MNKFLVGSTYFFNKIDGFSSKDIDYLELVDNPTNFKYSYQLTGRGKCYFKWRRISPEEFVEITLKYKTPMLVGKFLVPEFNEEIGFTIEHLKMLQPLIDNMDEKHLYEKIIYNSYIENDAFYLTNEQLMMAYKEYIKYRNTNE